MGALFSIINLVLYLFELCLFARAICSWVPSFRQSMVYNLVYKITEPVLSPVRDIIYKASWARRCPIDLSFLAVFLIISLLSSVTSYLAYAL